MLKKKTCDGLYEANRRFCNLFAKIQRGLLDDKKEIFGLYLHCSQEDCMTKAMKPKTLGDFYWAYADILRGIGINESTYDQRIMAFMALKLLVDNEKLLFNFAYRDRFGLDAKSYKKYQGKDTKETFLNLISDIKNLGKNLKYFIQNKDINPNSEDESVLYYLNHQRTFELQRYIEELPNNYFEMVLDIYTEKAHFVNYPKEKYKDLYEVTIARMKKLSGDLTGQHFTQKSIIHLMCEYAISDLKKSKNDILAIYDPACGTGSMLMESAHYFDEHINYTENGNKKKNNKRIEAYGQEIHGQTWLLCKIFLEIGNIPNTIAYGNTLTTPAFNKINGDNSFDFIIANPPFGVDWKHDYGAIIANMSKGKDSNYLVVLDEKGKLVIPKKSDGQFLFMLHILKLLEKSKESGKRAKAAVISSTGLITSGKATSSEGLIRQKIFNDGYIDTLLEQPKAMFTNTDISTLVWFFDNKQSKKPFFVKTDNSYINAHFKNKEIKALYSNAENKKDKQKNGYSDENIKAISSLIKNKIEFSLFSKYKKLDGDYTINFENEFSFELEKKEESFTLSQLEQSYEILSLAMLFGSELEFKVKTFKDTIDKVSSYIDGSYIDSFFDEYKKIYEEVNQKIISKDKNIKEFFIDAISKQKKREQEELIYIFEDIGRILESVKINMEIAV